MVVPSDFAVGFVQVRMLNIAEFILSALCFVELDVALTGLRV